MTTEYPIQKLANKYLDNSPSYVPGPLLEDIARISGKKSDEIVKLSSNENPLGPPPLSVKAIQEYATKVSLYPDSQANELRTAISKWLGQDGVSPENIVVGAGSSEVMSFIVRAFSSPGDEILCLNPSFILHREISAVEGRIPITVNLQPDQFRFDPETIIATVTPKTRIIFIARPNNPTSWLVPLDTVQKIMKSAPDVILVCDEAYVEFAEKYREVSAVTLMQEESNVIVTRTFSKAFGLCDLRVGYGIASRLAASYMRKIKPKWNVGMLAQHAALAALADEDHFLKTINTVKEGREFLLNEFRSMGFPVVDDPQGNFIMVNVGTRGFSSKTFFERLASKGISIRGGTEDVGSSYVRISIGTREQNQNLIASIRSFLT